MKKIIEKFKEAVFFFLLKRRCGRLCKAGKEFEAKSRQLFLAEFEKKFPNASLANASAFHRHILRYSLLSFFAFFLLSVSAFVYADQANLDPNQPLYKLKILGETIQLTFSPESKKAELNYEFAQKRLEEIKNLQQKEQVSAKNDEDKINQLSSEFDDNIVQALDRVDKVENGNKADANTAPAGKKKKLCDSISQAIADYDRTTSKEETAKKDNDKLQSHCNGSGSDKAGQDGSEKSD